MAVARLLVTGGTGFIGRHLCRVAAARDLRVTSLQLHSPKTPIDNVRHLTADLGDAAALTKVLRGEAFEYVVNCSGYINHTPYFSGGQALLAAHIDGLQNLLNVLDRQSLRRFVQIGSSDEYGSAPAPQVESLRESPIAPYSVGRTAATHLLQTLWRIEGFPAVILRLFLVYGPGQGEQRFLPQVIMGCLDNRPFPVSAGGQLRDFCFVEDVVHGILQALEAPQARGEVINIASGQPASIRQVLEQVQTLVGRGRPDFGKLPYRPGENMALWADVRKAERLIGWSPRTTLSDGLRKTIEYYKETA